MTMQDLIDKLKHRPKSVAEHRGEQLEEWKRALDGLYTRIESWLEPAMKQGVFEGGRADMITREEGFGTYDVPLLWIREGGVTIKLEPAAVRVREVVTSGGERHVGLRGQVDIVCGPMRLPLVRDANLTWKIMPLRGGPEELTEESFAAVLSELLLDE